MSAKPKDSAETIVFQNGNSLAIRIPKGLRFGRGTKVRIEREGNRLLVEPLADWPQGFAQILGAWSEPIERPADEGVRDPLA